MLGVRIASAIFLLPLLLWGFVGGSQTMVSIMVLCFALLSVYEIYDKLRVSLELRFDSISLKNTIGTSNNLQRTEKPSIPHFVNWFGSYYWNPKVYCGVLMLMTSIFVWANAEWAPIVAADLTLVLLLSMICLGMFSAETISKSVARTLAGVFSFVYCVFPWVVVVRLYDLGPHARYVILVMAVTWMGDTGAYFGGRFLGGKIFPGIAFAPNLSPKKTWEGAVVGLISSVAGAIIANWVFQKTLGTYTVMILVGLFGGIAAQLGDLLESGIKRFVGVKDSGTLIPGHGGFLDRVDGTMISGVIVWTIIRFT